MPGKRVVEQPIMLCVISACYRRLDAHQIPRARTRETGCCVGVGVGGGDAAVHGGGKAFRPFRRSEDACSEMSGVRASGAHRRVKIHAHDVTAARTRSSHDSRQHGPAN